MICITGSCERGLQAIIIDYAARRPFERRFKDVFLLGPNVQRQTQLELNAVEAAKWAGVQHIIVKH